MTENDIKFGHPFTPDVLEKFNANTQLQSVFTESIATEQDRMIRQVQEIGEQAYKNRKRMQEAMEYTAYNTCVANDRLEQIIDQQLSYINVLERTNETLQKQLQAEQRQIEILQNIFASGEDGVQVEKELMSLIKKEIDETHPLWEYVKDKGGDVAVTGVTAGISVLYNAFKMYLLSKGIL